jgi:ketosteroid isomerase-like protein
MADDIQWTEADGFPLAGTYVGPQAVLEGVFMRLGEIGDDFAVVPEQFIADGETVVALGSYGWKHRFASSADLGRLAGPPPPSGRRGCGLATKAPPC